jgi:predicted ArsR family transcriptional regulator
MLQALLNELKKDGTLSLSELAGRLGTTHALVQSMLLQLEHMGYLQQVDCATGACHGCELAAGGCASGKPQKLWIFKENSD